MILWHIGQTLGVPDRILEPTDPPFVYFHENRIKPKICSALCFDNIEFYMFFKPCRNLSL